MTPQRIAELERDPHAKLTREERQDGWHFCYEFDEMLTQGEMVDAEGRCAFCGFDKHLVT